MSNASRIVGHIICDEGVDKSEMITAIRNHIKTLSSSKENIWPALNGEIFGVTYSVEDADSVEGRLRSIIVHFQTSPNLRESEIEIWMTSFEKFLKSMPGANECIIHFSPDSSLSKVEYFKFEWFKKYLSKSSERYWVYQGDTFEWEELMEMGK